MINDVTYWSSVPSIALSVRVNGLSWYTHDRQNSIMVEYGIVTPQNVFIIKPRKGLKREAVYKDIVSKKIRNRRLSYVVPECWAK